jgi:hypothetical protein
MIARQAREVPAIRSLTPLPNGIPKRRWNSSQLVASRAGVKPRSS